MGLLDEAIREHLELKRRHGADPSAVAREEHEALAAVVQDEEVEPTAEASRLDGLPSHDEDAIADPAPAAAFDFDDSSEPAETRSFLNEETAEMDMAAALGGSGAREGGVVPVGQVADEADGGADTDESFDWEMPEADSRGAGVERAPGQERLSFE